MDSAMDGYPTASAIVVGGQPFNVSTVKHEDRPTFGQDRTPFSQDRTPFGQDGVSPFAPDTVSPFVPQQTYMPVFGTQAVPACTPTELIGSSLEEMGKSLSQAAIDLKSGRVNPTIPILQDLVHKITVEVGRLSFDTLSIQPSFPPVPPLIDPSALPVRKRPASPLSLDPSRPQKAQRPLKVEPTDEPLNPRPITSAPFLPSPPVNSAPPANPFDISSDPSLPSTPWTTPSAPIRHQHSLSAGAILPRPGPPITSAATTNPSSATSASTPVIGRVSRSGSVNGYPPVNLPFDYAEQSQHPFNVLNNPSPQWPANAATVPPSDLQPPTVPPPPPAAWGGPMTDVQPPPNPPSFPQDDTSPNDSNDDEPDPDDDADEDDHSGPAHSPDGSGLSSSGDIPTEYQADVDRIFFDFLNSLCSNLDATDSKGEPIHQTLMAKKMKRLDESGDFRPFKFRIAAFTSKFLERLAEEGFPEDKIPMKRVRNYLWHQPYILRYNEEGKKAKSKGNHIWNIDARKISDGKWEFRPFQRRLAGFPSGIAYRGLPWSYAARIWDPQNSWQNVPVSYHSPNLPSWLSWKDNVLSGIPGHDAVSCDITVIAKYNYHGQEGQLTHTFHLNVAPQSLDTLPARRVVVGSEQRPIPDSLTPRSRSGSLAAPSDILHVMENVKAQASNDLGAHTTNGADYQNLVKQAHVLEKTVNALVDNKPHSEAQALCSAANGVVTSAAKLVFSQLSSSRPPSMNEVSCLTKAAISEAVVMNGTRSNEVDIILTAESLLKKEHGFSPAYRYTAVLPVSGSI